MIMASLTFSFGRYSWPMRKAFCGVFATSSWAKHQTIGGGVISKKNKFYPLVNEHSNWKAPFWIGNISSKGPFSIAMLDYRRVTRFFFEGSYLCLLFFFAYDVWQKQRHLYILYSRFFWMKLLSLFYLSLLGCPRKVSKRIITSL